jgi:hypothetical protein
MIFDEWLPAMILKRGVKAKSVNPQISQIPQKEKYVGNNVLLFLSRCNLLICGRNDKAF